MSENVVKIDARGKECPIPVVLTLKALKDFKGAGTVVTSVDNAAAVQNLKNLGTEKNVPVTVTEQGDYTDLTFAVPEGGVQAADTDDAFVASCTPGAKKNVVVQITSDAMGSGDDKLGQQLMKAYIFALTQLDELPQTILFYNGGAKLTCEGSLCLEDLKGLEDAGVKIMTCGTCLNYYGLSDKLKVGSVTNMYSIAETLENATLVVRP